MLPVYNFHVGVVGPDGSFVSIGYFNLKIVGRGSETQLPVGEKLNHITMCLG